MNEPKRNFIQSIFQHIAANARKRHLTTNWFGRTQNWFGRTQNWFGRTHRCAPTMKLFLTIAIFVFSIANVRAAYTVATSCPDFTDITASYVEATYGSTSNPFAYQGIVTDRHTLITSQGTDPNTGNVLQLLPPGESKVVRLGNSRVGAEAEALTYHFMVDIANPVLLLKFAVVFEDPGHNIIAQPRFVLRIMDANGNLIESCSEYDVSAGAGIDGFQTYNRSNDIYSQPVQWRDWTNVGLDMSNFAGKEVQVQIVTYDCAHGAHFGYAYFTAACMSTNLQMESCAGSSFTAVAPENFASYLWDNGDNTRTSTRSGLPNNTGISCLVTSATGCSVRLYALVTGTVPPQSEIISDVICEGEPYTKNYFNLPPQYESGTHYNTFLNPATCNDNISTTLLLTVLQRYYPVIATICQGEDYSENGFDIRQPAAGLRRDTLWLLSQAGACDSIICLELTVSPSLNMPNTILGETTPCTGEPVTYSFAGDENMTSFNWQIPSNATIIGGINSSQLMVYFTTADAGSITLSGANGCGSNAIPLPVQPKPSYNLFFTDSVCTGCEYNKHGFNLGAFTDGGYQVFSKELKTVQGCDSTATLELFVFPKPELSILLEGDSVLCAGETVTLNAIGSGASFEYSDAIIVPEIAVGDILCTDNSIVKLNDYAASGKTAMGVVFYVDSTEKHGWAVHLQDQGTDITWSYSMVDIPTLTNYGHFSYFVPSLGTSKPIPPDFDGYSNTQKIRDFGNAIMYPAAYAVDFNNGWYLPAAGQLALLRAEMLYINASLTAIGGTEFGPPYYLGRYWSSTELNNHLVYLDFDWHYKNYKYTVRSIRDF